MTDHCTTDFCIWQTICLDQVRCISSISHMYTTDIAYDRPIFLVPLSPSYPSSPVITCQHHLYSFMGQINIQICRTIHWCHDVHGWLEPFQSKTIGEPISVISRSLCKASRSLGSISTVTESQSWMREAERGAESGLFLEKEKAKVKKVFGL